MKTKYMWVLILPFLAACSAKNGSVAFNPKADKVIDASAKERPDWLRQANHGFVKNGIVYRIGVTEGPADASPRKLTEVASMKARSELAHELRTKLENRVQYASEGLGIEQESLERIVTMGSKLENINGLRTQESYYEKVAVSDGYTESIKYVAYSLVGLEEKEYRRQLAAAIRGNVDKRLSQKFQQKVDKNWNDFFDSNSQTADTNKDELN